MTLLVPFDGSDLSEAALVRAAEFRSVLDDDLLAVTVLPGENDEYAREKGWVGPNERLDMKSVVTNLRKKVASVCPEAEFRYEVVDRYAPSGTIAKRVRKIAKDEDARLVFVGSDNAGHFVTSMATVGQSIATDEAYDVVIVRNRSPDEITPRDDVTSRKQVADPCQSE
ncbi:universal stress protein [Halorussus salilacus]|uniref:universal stress protein n=1 Tax=Halorussus salilacus TaxID=2953750 RepID=UPI00209D2C93|nr:universal stress protein [Halorussus salilacus]USZ68970.1 universal stress protein [Halorussus salilacus]